MLTLCLDNSNTVQNDGREIYTKGEIICPFEVKVRVYYQTLVGTFNGLVEATRVLDLLGQQTKLMCVHKIFVKVFWKILVQQKYRITLFASLTNDESLPEVSAGPIGPALFMALPGHWKYSHWPCGSSNGLLNIWGPAKLQHPPPQLTLAVPS